MVGGADPVILERSLRKLKKILWKIHFWCTSPSSRYVFASNVSWLGYHLNLISMNIFSMIGACSPLKRASLKRKRRNCEAFLEFWVVYWDFGEKAVLRVNSHLLNCWWSFAKGLHLFIPFHLFNCTQINSLFWDLSSLWNLIKRFAKGLRLAVLRLAVLGLAVLRLAVLRPHQRDLLMMA